MKTIIVIQLRTGSTRLFRKIYRLVDQDEMWERIYKIAESTGLQTVLAIPHDDQQLSYVRYRRKGAYKWIPGEEHDLINRFKGVVEELELEEDDKIVRLTADCPLLTKEAILSAIYGAEGKEYYYNGIEGFDVEVFTVRALMEADKNTKEEDRGHVTKYLRKKYMDWTMTIPHFLSVDTEEDLVLVKEILKNARKQQCLK